MNLWTGVDWGRLFGSDTPLLELVVRGSLVYLALFVILRVVLNRQAGAVGISDLLVVVLIADAAQNGLAGEYTSITDGIILVGVIVFWSYFLDWLGFRFPAFQRIVRPPALQLVRDGRPLRRNMARELITDEELASSLRQQGVDDLSAVKAAYIEGDGRISVITRDGEQHGSSERRGV
jgi:uncharacterized membrane protein YcaP (DUF421 family)